MALFVLVVLLATAGFAVFLWWQLAKADQQLTDARATIDRLTSERDTARRRANVFELLNPAKPPGCTCHTITDTTPPPADYTNHDSCPVHGLPQPYRLGPLALDQSAELARIWCTCNHDTDD